MDWTRSIDGYCERVDPSFWAEPINAVTNLAFIMAAILMWRRHGRDVLAAVLCGIVFAIGLGSFLFHTFAQPWAGLADVLPILIFILVYLYAMNRVGLRLGRWSSWAGVALFFPYAALLVPLFQRLTWLGGSAAYAPVPVLILIYAVLLRHNRSLASGLTVGAGVLIISLTFRTLDEPLCYLVPIGTHFMWHVLNGVMLAWMIEVYARAALGKGRAEG